MSKFFNKNKIVPMNAKEDFLTDGNNPDDELK